MTQKKSVKPKSKKEKICCRKHSQLFMAILLQLVIVGGYFCPRLGFIVLGLITIFMILASKRGRFYCDWLCPMDSFQGISSKSAYLLTVEYTYVKCKKWLEVSPTSTYPVSFKREGGTNKIPSIECLRCSTV